MYLLICIQFDCMPCYVALIILYCAASQVERERERGTERGRDYYEVFLVHNTQWHCTLSVTTMHYYCSILMYRKRDYHQYHKK